MHIKASTITGAVAYRASAQFQESKRVFARLRDVPAPRTTPRATTLKETSEYDSHIKPGLLIMKRLVEKLTGHRIDTLRLRELHAEVALNPRLLELELVETSRMTYDEHQLLKFGMSGTVQLSDGRSIAFDMAAMLRQDFHIESTAIKEPAKVQDPLVLNIGKAFAGVDSRTYSFDLNSDGEMEEIRELSAGSGFLVNDINGNGTVDDGSELFGPMTGDGFSELARLDSDNNGWIDEGDDSYSSLGVWLNTSDGKKTLIPLSKAGVGALSIRSLSAPFAIRDTQGVLAAHSRAASVYLREDGTPGVLQQVDIIL